jgi:hypothetical protein
MAGKKKLSARLKSLIKPESLETFRETPKDIAKGVVGSLKNDVAGASVTDMWAQIYGLPEHSHEKPHHGEKPQKKEGLSQSGEIFNANDHGEQKKATADISPGIDYRNDILHGSERKRRAEVQQIGDRYQEIIVELKRIASSARSLQEKVKHVVTEQVPQEIGTYHLNFAEWLLLTLRQARQNVEDSGAWLNIGKKKKGMIQNAWKKGDTATTMSNERQVATQTG